MSIPPWISSGATCSACDCRSDGENDGEDDGCDLTEELGEDYWMTDGSSPDGEEESPSFSSDGEEAPDDGAGAEK